ncbi:lytic transglycosylase domain-containing protein [Rothia sp. ZJ1223]|uniref:lytic transglycosylase domain-containing protein n=1 Tax=Rothia sp. ZJ1223 TaxID=2811098 RepID=UPI0019597178|nr:lytic transglycosylase domain-containing protein [Rothia sp. ZJ1223]MBM7052095.1 lytic transglycosylase domain-containing protein [Rothia sp. ZJ1223]
MATDKKTSYGAPIRVLTGVLAHWQVIASAVLLGIGVAGLAATYNSYCGMTDLAYAPTEVHDNLRAASTESGVRTGILAAQLETESRWRVGAASPAGAQGLAQFTPDTWEIWGQDGDIRDPEDAIRTQGHYLAYLRDRLEPLADNEQELQDLMLAGYNAGPGAVEEFKGIPPYPETQGYVKKINQLGASKYQVTCHPDPAFKQEKIRHPDR